MTDAMNVEILEVKVNPVAKFSWDPDKTGNRWNRTLDHPFRFRVKCKLRIDGKIVETWKETKHLEMDTDLSSPCTSTFARELLRKIHPKYEIKLTKKLEGIER